MALYCAADEYVEAASTVSAIEGATTLTITHDMSSARTIADRVAMLYGGKIIWAGGVDDIDQCDNPFVDQFIHGREEGPFALEVT